MLETIKIESTTPAAAIPIHIVEPANLAKLLEQLGPRAANWLKSTGFAAKPHSHALIPDDAGAVSAVVVGGSADSPFFLSHLPAALGEGVFSIGPQATPQQHAAAALSWGLGAYQFDRYRRREPRATLWVPPSDAVTHALDALRSIQLVRDLVNTPAEDMGPQQLANVARDLAGEFGASFREFVGEELLAANYPAIHAVGRAATRAPRLIELNWGNDAHPRIAIAGKGVCFDSGGLDIKSADGMRQMKKDMGGAAHALGLARLIMARGLPVRLQVLIPAVENAIAGNAYRPGDIVATRKGLNIEIGNTDAEGRVVLSDALAYAAEAKPELILDFATLTGAARIALGPELPATFANDDAWFTALEAASRETRDPLWRMPLWQGYNAMIKSGIGDIVNTGGPQAGAVTAALFLEHFVPRGQPWIHIDLFAWTPKAKPGRPEGGEAQTLRAVMAMLEGRYGG